MKPILILFFAFLNFSSSQWTTDFPKAKLDASQEHKFILLNFSGSDWCIPCIRLHEDVFEKAEFVEYASSNLILINADFPRLKKNKLSNDLQRQNDDLASQYNPNGIFPLTILLTADGKQIKSWEGNTINAQELVSEIKTAACAH
jgi:thioredoxin-related protein